MAFLRKLIKWILYVFLFGAVFMVALYLSFPIDALRPYVVSQIEKSLSGEGQQAPWVFAPQVKMGRMSLWRLSGLSITDLSIDPGSRSLEPSTVWKFEHVKFRMGIWSTLSGYPKFEFDTRLFSGYAKGYVTMTPKGGVSQFAFNISQVNLAEMTGQPGEGKLPMRGEMNMDADFYLGQDPAKDGDGALNFSFKQLAMGPGELQLPMPGMVGGIPIPKVKLGQFSGRLSLKNGKGKTENLRLAGGDIETHINLDVDLVKNIMFSKLDGAGWFRIAPKFLEANPSFQAILSFSPEIAAAREPNGKISFVLKGTLGMPMPRFGKQLDESERPTLPFPTK